MATSVVVQSPLEQGAGMEWVRVVTAELQVCVHPAWSNNVLKGVQENLNSLLFKYNEDLEGVVLAYLDLKIPSHKAKLLSGLSPYFRVNPTAKLLIFSPKVGVMLEGKVNKIEEDYIGVLVLGLFNAVISVTEIRDGFHFLEEDFERSWVNASQKHVIKLGTIIRFSVKRVEEKEEFLDLFGSLIPSDTGSLEWLTLTKPFELSEGHSEKRRKKRLLEPVKNIPLLMHGENVYRYLVDTSQMGPLSGQLHVKTLSIGPSGIHYL